MSVLLGLAVGTSRSAAAQTVAEVNGDPITTQELQQASGQSLATLEEQAYRLKEQALNQLVGDRLIAQEAKRRGVPVETLMKTEITSKLAPVTDTEIHALFEANKAQLQNSEAELRPQLEAFLQSQRQAMRRQEFLSSLRSGAAVKVFLTAPAPFRAEIQGTGPSRGPADAPVTIVEFEDFQCPFCKQVHETVERVLAKYQDKIRIVHRDFPLDALHPAAHGVHRAGRCATEQGKFWEYRSLLYANAPNAGAEQLASYAEQAQLDVPAFTSCVARAEPLNAAIQTDLEEGERLGVSGTPAFFINGRLLSGSQPESEFSRVIEEELTRASAGR